MTWQFWPSGLRRQFKALVFGRGFESRRLYFFFCSHVQHPPGDDGRGFFFVFWAGDDARGDFGRLGPRWASSRTYLPPWSRHTQPVRHETRAATPS